MIATAVIAALCLFVADVYHGDGRRNAAAVWVGLAFVAACVALVGALGFGWTV